jgi:hypothetical protein
LSTSLVAVWYSSDGFEFVGALPQFGQQPRVLDGDHGLRSEVGHELDLLVVERTDLLAEETDDPDQVVVLDHRHAERGPNAGHFHGLDRPRMALDKTGSPLDRIREPCGRCSALRQARHQARDETPYPRPPQMSAARHRSP